MRKCLEIIWKSGGITKPGLAVQSGLTPVTAHKFINELFEIGIVSETGVSDAQLGKKALVYGINPGYGCFIGVNIYNRVITASAFDFRMKALHVETGPFPGEYSEAAFDMLCAAASGLIARAGRPILGIGVTLSGPIDFQRGIAMNCMDMKGWNNIPLKQMLEKRLGIPAVVENDVNASSIALKWLMAPKNCFAFVGISSGVGIGLMVNNEVYRGPNSNAGELGHATITPRGKLCRCGNRGCIEEYVSDDGILEESGCASLDDVVAEARKGSPAVQEVLRNKCEYIAILLDFVVKAYDPNVIYLNSEWMNRLPQYFGMLSDAVYAKSQWLGRERLDIALLERFDEPLQAVKGPAYAIFDNYLNNGCFKQAQ